MAIAVVTGSQWHIAYGSETEVVQYMGTGSVNPVDLKGFTIHTDGSPAVLYHR